MASGAKMGNSFGIKRANHHLRNVSDFARQPEIQNYASAPSHYSGQNNAAGSAGLHSQTLSVDNFA